jgi:hypothetical protein
MGGAEIYKTKADELLRAATATTDMAERSRLISEAVRWHMMASGSESLSGAVALIDLSEETPDFDASGEEAP